MKLNRRTRCKRRSESGDSKNSGKLNKGELIMTCLKQLILILLKLLAWQITRETMLLTFLKNVPSKSFPIFALAWFWHRNTGNLKWNILFLRFFIFPLSSNSFLDKSGLPPSHLFTSRWPIRFLFVRRHFESSRRKTRN